MSVKQDATAAEAPAAELRSEPVSAAFFDVDGTLVSTNIVHYYMYFRRRMMGRWIGPLWQGAYYFRCLYFLILDHINRSRMNVAFYQDYAGLNADAVRSLGDDCFRVLIEPNLFPGGAAQVKAHQRDGTRVAFVTGSLDFIMNPLARHLGVADVIAAEMGEREGKFTGNLTGPPIGEQVKADGIRTFANAHGIDLAASYAYGDSVADVPMLESVGRPQVVNPNRTLRALATSRGWPVHRWSRDTAVRTPVTAS